MWWTGCRRGADILHAKVDDFGGAAAGYLHLWKPDIRNFAAHFKGVEVLRTSQDTGAMLSFRVDGVTVYQYEQEP